MLSDTTQSDLEQLLAEVDRGWCAYRDGLENPVVSFGIGGCLTEEMDRVLTGRSTRDFISRKTAMRNALGFSIYHDMYVWNDAQRDPDAIRHRIKDALNGEYSNAQ